MRTERLSAVCSRLRVRRAVLREMLPFSAVAGTDVPFSSYRRMLFSVRALPVSGVAAETRNCSVQRLVFSSAVVDTNVTSSRPGCSWLKTHIAPSAPLHWSSSSSAGSYASSNLPLYTLPVRRTCTETVSPARPLAEVIENARPSACAKGVQRVSRSVRTRSSGKSLFFMARPPVS